MLWPDSDKKQIKGMMVYSGLQFGRIHCKMVGDNADKSQLVAFYQKSGSSDEQEMSRVIHLKVHPQ